MSQRVSLICYKSEGQEAGGVMNDLQCIKKIAEGDIEALETLYLHYRTNVYRLAYVLTKNRDCAEDITQDVFLSIIKNADHYRYDGSVKSWILSITRNLAFNVIKRSSHSLPLEEESLSLYLPLHQTDPFEEIELIELLSNLRLDEQEIVVLHILYGFSHLDIAKIMSLTHDAVRKRYRRALAKLKNKMTWKEDDFHCSYPSKKDSKSGSIRSKSRTRD